MAAGSGWRSGRIPNGWTGHCPRGAGLRSDDVRADQRDDLLALPTPLDPGPRGPRSDPFRGCLQRSSALMMPEAAATVAGN